MGPRGKDVSHSSRGMRGLLIEVRSAPFKKKKEKKKKRWN
jgi:hypothetical protein